MRNLAQMTDEDLALLYMDGNNQAFDILLSRNQQKIFTYILFVVHDEDLANDLFQDAFVKIIVKLRSGRYAPTGKFGAWCMRVAHNVIMDHYRMQRSNKTVEMGEENELDGMASDALLDSDIETLYANQQVLRDVRRLMEFLPTTQREVAYMRFYQQLSFKEIAETTGVSINTSLGRMRYAVLNMRRMAREHGVELAIN